MFTEEDFKPYRKLCSLHFDKDCFKTGNILKPNSVPTKFRRRSKEFFESMYVDVYYDISVNTLK